MRPAGPSGLAVENAGKLDVADMFNDFVAAIKSATGVLSEVAGLPRPSQFGGGDGAPRRQRD